jgi:hypothetical protein
MPSIFVLKLGDGVARLDGFNERGTYFNAETFLIGGSRFHIEVARTSIGAHNEHFLHHRRRGRNTRDCRLPRTACLNKRSNTRSTLVLRPFNSRLTAFVTSAVNLMKGTLRDYASNLCTQRFRCSCSAIMP